MAIDFPNSPIFLQYYPPAVPGESGYIWDGEKWTSGGGSSGTTLDFPSSPVFGQMYKRYIWDGEKWTWRVTTAPGGGDAIFSIVGNPMIVILEDF